jgi:hypothetical protein
LCGSLVETSFPHKPNKKGIVVFDLDSRAGATNRGKRPLILIQQQMRLRKRLCEGKGPSLRTKILLRKSLFLQWSVRVLLAGSAGGSGADEKQILADFAFVLSSFLPKNRTKVQENHNVFNERLPDS